MNDQEGNLSFYRNSVMACRSPGALPAIEESTVGDGGRGEILQFRTASPRTFVSHWVNSPTRRAFECAAALIALTVLSPALLLIALCVRIGSRGPALFKQERMGRAGRSFLLYKFRTMVEGGQELGAITVAGDRRVNSVGRFLRRCKLDELPQLWNVLRGDMSLVGPRPKLPQHEALHMAFRPGLTGAASLAFRFEEELLREVPAEAVDSYYQRFLKPRKAQLDWNYMTKATFRSDLKLLLQTALCLFASPKNRSDLRGGLDTPLTL
jgi:lipopolysaccharide/colanic/teichoic acid biosynthesis glycosyltransferase